MNRPCPELQPVQPRSLGGLRTASRLARHALTATEQKPGVLQVGGRELAARRAGSRVVRAVSYCAPEAVKKNLPNTPDELARSIVSRAVDHYGVKTRAKFEDEQFVEAAIDCSLKYEQKEYASGPVRTMMKRLEYARSSAPVIRGKLKSYVKSEILRAVVGEAIYEGANTIFALFEVVPHVVRNQYPDASTAQALELTYQTARTVPRLAVEWSGLSKEDDARAIAQLRSTEVDENSKYTGLRFSPDYFEIAECPKTGRTMLAMKQGIFTPGTDEIRYGCPAYAEGGITKLCRSMEDEIAASGMYESQITQLYATTEEAAYV